MKAIVAFCALFFATGYLSTLGGSPWAYLPLFAATWWLGGAMRRHTKIQPDIGLFLILGVTALGCVVGIATRHSWVHAR